MVINMAMDRKTLFENLDKERQYQSRWDNAGTPGRLMDKDKPVSSWSNWMQTVLREADSAAYRSNDKAEAAKKVYEAVALGIAYLEHNGDLISEEFFAERYKNLPK